MAIINGREKKYGARQELIISNMSQTAQDILDLSNRIATFQERELGVKRLPLGGNEKEKSITHPKSETDVFSAIEIFSDGIKYSLDLLEQTVSQLENSINPKVMSESSNSIR